MKILVSCITLLTIALTYHHVAGQFTRPPISTITDCEGSVFDIVFVLDSSGSVGYDNFTVMKSFVKAVVQNLEIADNKTRVGLMTYSRYPFIRINLQDYSNKTELLEAVDQVPYIPGITETQSALELLLQEGFKGDRPYAPHVGVVVTDGKSFHTNQTASAAEAARQSGITLIAVGIGTEINTAELNSIASDPDSQHVFTVSNFASLHQIVTTLTAKACNATALTPPITTQLPTSPTTQLLITKVNETSENCNRTLADLVFVLDSSGSLGFENFNKVKQFAIDIVNYLDIGPNFTKVGVITYSNYPNRRFKLDSYTDKLQLVNAINQIPYYPGNTETDKALDMLRLEGFEGDRPNAPNIAIIVTDGLSTNPGLTKISASQVKNGGITVFAVGIGAEIDTAELKYISSDPDNQYVFFVGNFSSLPTIESTVARTTCNVKLVTTMPTPTTQSTTTTTTTRMTTPSCTARVADVMFVLDTSGSVGPDNFLQIKHFVKQTISVFDIATDFTRVGIITYSTNADIAFPLNTYNTTASLNAAIDGIVFTHGGTNTGAALELLRTKGFQYDRDDAPNIAIVMTDGLSKDKINTKLQATLAKNNNITIIAIGVGNSTDQEELNNLATFDVLNNRNLVYQVGDFAALDTLNSTVATVACGFVLPENLPTTTPPPQTIPGCHDTIPNCDEYGSDICYDYKPWAEAHCAARCGFCVGPTTTAPVCENRLNNCHEYGTYICTTSSLIAWTKKNCAQYCGICANGSIPTEPPINPQVLTTQSQQPCIDLRDNCNEYGGKAMCSDPQYRGWSHKNCYKYCGYCITTITETKVNNVTCPAWELPSACTMSTTDGTCCPFPICPDGYLLTAKAP